MSRPETILKAISRKITPKEGTAKEESVEVGSNLRIPDSELRILWLESRDSRLAASAEDTWRGTFISVPNSGFLGRWHSPQIATAAPPAPRVHSSLLCDEVFEKTFPTHEISWLPLALLDSLTFPPRESGFQHLPHSFSPQEKIRK